MRRYEYDAITIYAASLTRGDALARDVINDALRSGQDETWRFPDAATTGWRIAHVIDHRPGLGSITLLLEREVEIGTSSLEGITTELVEDPPAGVLERDRDPLDDRIRTE